MEKDNPQRLIDILNEAEMSLAGGNFPEAVELYEKARRINPNNYNQKIMDLRNSLLRKQKQTRWLKGVVDMLYAEAKDLEEFYCFENIDDEVNDARKVLGLFDFIIDSLYYSDPEEVLGKRYLEKLNTIRKIIYGLHQNPYEFY